MGTVRQPLTAETFKHFKELHQHRWKWLGEGKMTNGDRWAYCECENCGHKRWVMWTHIRRKLSTQCRKCCRRVKDLSGAQAKINAVGGTWEVLTYSKIITGRRYFLCKCRQCKRTVWRQWSAINAGKARSCRSCGMKKKKGVYLNDMPRWKRSLYLIWKTFSQGCNRRSKLTKSWNTFEEFVRWSESRGYRYGYRLYLKKRGGTHYSPDTCDWKPTKYVGQETKNAGKNTVNVRYSHAGGIP